MSSVGRTRGSREETFGLTNMNNSAESLRTTMGVREETSVIFFFYTSYEMDLEAYERDIKKRQRALREKENEKEGREKGVMVV